MTDGKILLIEDDPDISELLRFNLSEEGFRVETAARGLDGLERLRTKPPDLLILDLMLPDLSGIEICKRVRASESIARLPVLMLTAKGEEIDRVVGFEVGADDYITKPFSMREFLLRVRALLRRSQQGPDGAKTIRVSGLELDGAGYRARINGEELPLTVTEFKLLRFLLENPTRLLTREHLLESVWGYAEDVESRTVDAHVRRLRKKLGDYADIIETVHGAGYRYNVTKYGEP
ncbi:MAG: response regulator transcription factor [Bdellovibrionota bacterium]